MKSTRRVFLGLFGAGVVSGAAVSLAKVRDKQSISSDSKYADLREWPCDCTDQRAVLGPYCPGCGGVIGARPVSSHSHSIVNSVGGHSHSLSWYP